MAKRSNVRITKVEDIIMYLKNNHYYFGNCIRNIMTVKGMTQKELAAKAGITVSSLSRYINDKRIPYVDTAFKIAGALGVSVDELIKGVIKA